jgi:hypothetical protein
MSVLVLAEHHDGHGRGELHAIAAAKTWTV